MDSIEWICYIFGAPTFTGCAISSKSLFTSADVRPLTVGTISVLVTWVGISRTLVYICCCRKKDPSLKILILICTSHFLFSKTWIHFSGVRDVQTISDKYEKDVMFIMSQLWNNRSLSGPRKDVRGMKAKVIGQQTDPMC